MTVRLLPTDVLPGQRIVYHVGYLVRDRENEAEALARGDVPMLVAALLLCGHMSRSPARPLGKIAGMMPWSTTWPRDVR